MGQFLIYSVMLVFVVALVSSYMQHRRLDRVLRDLVGFHVTLEFKDKQIWGRFKLYANAIELIFNRDYRNHRGLKLTSFILFTPQIVEVEEIFRFHDELTPANQQYRLSDIERTQNPDFWRRAKRSLRNFMVAFREAISESLGMLVSRVQKTGSMALLKDADGQLKKLGNDILDVAGSAGYDPVLEAYIFHQVVAEIERGDGKKTEYAGVLKEYSAAWISILDCRLYTDNDLSLMDANRLMVQRNMDFEIEIRREQASLLYRLSVTSTDSQDIELLSIQDGEEYSHPINTTLKPGGRISIELKDLPEACRERIDAEALPISLSLIAPERLDEASGAALSDDTCQNYPVLPELTLNYRTYRHADVYLPRNKARVRHGGEFIE